MWKGYFSLDNDNKSDKFALVWANRDRRYLTSNTSSFKPGLTYARERVMQVYNIPNSDPVHVEFEINYPMVAERYYSINLKMDERNHTRQDDFQL